MKKTTDQFVAAAKLKHGEKYDYSKVNYVSYNTKVTIICSTHNEFEQNPGTHLQGKGCPKCAGKGKTTEDFIAEARVKHGEKYDYSKLVYKSSRTKVIIICPKHDEFNQIAVNHLQGAGCPKCGVEDKCKPVEQFIREASECHDNKYDYSKVLYQSSYIKVIIICPLHGEFEQRPVNHIKSRGCPKCGNITIGDKLRKNKEQFIFEAMKIHNNKYDYSLVEYVNSKTNIVIICPKHGEFTQQPPIHLRGSGCPKCGNVIIGDKLRKTTEQFILEATKIHGEFYDYLKVVYLSAQKKVIIICPKHGAFEQNPDSHLRGCGCPVCNSSKGEFAIANYLELNKIDYEREKLFDNCKHKRSLPFDFYIPKIRLLIEFDGIQHYKPVECFGGEKALRDRLMKDGIKNKYAKDNDYYLVRIRDINNIEVALKPYIELYNIENPENYVVCDGELFYDDLD